MFITGIPCEFNTQHRLFYFFSSNNSLPLSKNATSSPSSTSTPPNTAAFLYASVLTTLSLNNFVVFPYFWLGFGKYGSTAKSPGRREYLVLQSDWLIDSSGSVVKLSGVDTVCASMYAVHVCLGVLGLEEGFLSLVSFGSEIGSSASSLCLPRRQISFSITVYVRMEV
jgi:hypothetical protein